VDEDSDLDEVVDGVVADQVELELEEEDQLVVEGVGTV